MPIQKSFEDFLTEHINLTPTEKTQGAKSQSYIREILDNKNKSDSSFPWLIDGDFLSGSYIRNTKIRPLDDIDIMIVLDGAGFVAVKGGVRVNAIVRGSNKIGNPTLKYLDRVSTNGRGCLSSQKILELFRDSLKESYPDSRIRKDGQAVNVWFDSLNLGLDIVPCFHIQPQDSGKEHYYIPFGTGSTMWRSTNPKIDEEISTSLNIVHNGNLVPIVKLIKYWNQFKNNGRLKSYHLEVLAWRVFNNYPNGITNYAEALKYFFDNMAGFLSPCPDPTGLGERIDSYLTEPVKQQTITEAIKIQPIINASIFFQRGGQVQNAKEMWQKVFGNQFKV